MELSALSEAFLITGVALLIISILFVKFPPKKINGLYGYRTNRSMKSQAAWDFAQKLSARYLLRFSLLICLLSLIFAFFEILEWPWWLPMLIYLATLIFGFTVLIQKVESQLIRKFGKGTFTGNKT